MTLDAKHLERAVRRWWFTHPDDNGKPLKWLTPFAQRSIVKIAFEIQEEACNQPTNA